MPINNTGDVWSQETSIKMKNGENDEDKFIQVVTVKRFSRQEVYIKSIFGKF